MTLPLYDIFERLRALDWPLGVDDYTLLIRALQAGYGVENEAALRTLCCTLWAKSRDEQQMCDEVFQLVMAQYAAKEGESRRPNLPPPTELLPPSPIQPPGESTQLPQPPPSVPESLVRLDDEVQVAKAVQNTASHDDEVTPSRFVMATEYFPVTRRQMKQSWRTLRRAVREGPSVELDIAATVRQVGKEGTLLAPVLVPQRVNRTDLYLLLDQAGSMVPFHSLSRRLAETAVRGGKLGSANIFYFHDCPKEYLYRDLYFLDPQPLSDTLRLLNARRSIVLIFSDGGAARGNYDDARVEETAKFLAALKQHVRYVAWLNPMPPSRWRPTTAGSIAQHVPMFEMSRAGLDGSLRVLRGRLTPLRGRSNG